jgi:hypothetical protein
VDLVGQSDAQHAVVVDVRQVGDVGRLALPPAALVLDRVKRVRAGGHDLGHALTEVAPQALEQLAPAAVLDAVVEHRRNRLVLVAAVLEHEARDDEQVRHVGDLGSEPAAAVDLRGEVDGGDESLTEGWRCLEHSQSLRTRPRRAPA